MKGGQRTFPTSPLDLNWKATHRTRAADSCYPLQNVNLPVMTGDPRKEGAKSPYNNLKENQRECFGSFVEFWQFLVLRVVSRLSVKFNSFCKPDLMQLRYFVAISLQHGTEKVNCLLTTCNSDCSCLVKGLVISRIRDPVTREIINS